MSSSVLFPTPITLVGSVLNPYVTKFADSQSGGVQAVYDQSGAPMIGQTRGSFAPGAIRGVSFTASATALTVPVNAITLVSVFGIYNPPGSGVWAELVNLDIVHRLAPAIPNVIGLAYSNVGSSGLATFTTKGSTSSNFLGSASGKVQFYTAVTHSGTPTIYALTGAWGAATDTTISGNNYKFDGTVLIPPGILVSVANLVTVSSAADTDISLTWLEYNQ
jgi:hypothetical protein